MPKRTALLILLTAILAGAAYLLLTGSSIGDTIFICCLAGLVGVGSFLAVP